MSKRSYVVVVAILTLIAAGPGPEASDLIITGVIDGPLSGGLPKAVEFFTTADIPNLSIYGFGSANNGGGTDGEEFTFPAVSVDAGTCLYVASEAAGFNTFFGFAPNFTGGAANINGDDAIELFQNGVVTDVFGEINVDGTGQVWEHLDGWAYRIQATGPDGSTFVFGNWYFSNPNALDGETSNSTAAVPFPIGSYGGCTPPSPPPDGWIINETDSDTPGADTLEFVELFDGGVGSSSLDGLVVVFYNGSGDVSYNAFDLDGFTSDASGYFVLGNAGISPTPDIIFSGNGLQNGADAVALYEGDSADFPSGTAVTTTGLIDAIVYDTNDADDAGLLVLLNAGQPQVNEGGAGDNDNHSNRRCPNGEGGTRNTDTYLQGAPTPAADNQCGGASADFIINETDSDTPGSDTLEFVELYDGGVGNTSLNGLVLVFYNGNGDKSYDAFDLDGFTSDSYGFFLLGNVGVTPAPDIVFGSGGLQNGADAVALYVGDASDFPNGTLVTTTGLVDAIVYDTNDGDDAGLLVLLNTSQPQVNEDGAGDKDNHSNQRCPNGSGGARNTDTYIQDTPTPATDNQCPGPPQPPVKAEIFEIQGSGLTSPFVGQTVLTEDNSVTALALDGFFIQTPAARSDNDIDTSDGIFVFTDGAPPVAVGDRVDVTGVVAEFFNFTEINSPTVTVTGSGSVPSSVAFGATTPSPDPLSPSCAIEFECYEGMLVQVVDGTVTGPNQRFNVDLYAEAHIVTYSARAFREPGVEFPGLGIPSIPTWDGNPEVFELDPDRLGLPNQILPAGSTFSASGVLGFEFGGYELWPTELTVNPVDLPRAVWPRQPGEFTVGTLNLFRLFDDVDDPPDGGRNDLVVSTTEYMTRLVKFSAHIREVLDAPDVLAVQEAEKLGVLEDLADQIALDDPSISYTAYLLEGNDIGTIDVGFLVRSRVEVDSITQLGKDEIFSYDDSLLHDRPPLLLEGSCQLEFGASPIAVLTVHNRSLSGIESSSSGERVRLKRYTQAESIAMMVQDLQITDPDIRLAVVGDFNAFEFTDGYVDGVGIIKGDFLPYENLICATEPCADLVDPNLTNQVLNLLTDERYSFIFRGNAQVLDHVLTSVGLGPEVTALAFGRGNADAAVEYLNDGTTTGVVPLRSSDHDGLVLYLLKDEDADGVPNDLDYCPDTVIPESVPTVRLGTNRWALVDEDRYFDTTSPKGKGPKRSYSLGDTAGCSCEQIIEALHLGKGHQKFGCSNGAMDNWVQTVQP